MNFWSVYRSLLEVFPEVDAGILKAVAIEHSTDVDAAIEFVCYEVLSTAPWVESHPNIKDYEKSLEDELSSLGFLSSPREDKVNPSLISCQDELEGKSHRSDCDGALAHGNSSVGSVVESKEIVVPFDELRSLGFVSSPGEDEVNSSQIPCQAELVGKIPRNEYNGALVHGNSSSGSVVAPIEIIVPFDDLRSLGFVSSFGEGRVDSSLISCQAEILGKGPRNDYHGTLMHPKSHIPEEEISPIDSDQSDVIKKSPANHCNNAVVHDTLSTQDRSSPSVGSMLELEKTVILSEHKQILEGTSAVNFFETISLASENVVVNSMIENCCLELPPGELSVKLSSVVQDECDNGHVSWVHEVDEVIHSEEVHDVNDHSTLALSLDPCEHHSPLLAATMSQRGLNSETNKMLRSFSKSFSEDSLASSTTQWGEESFFSVKTSAISSVLDSESDIDDEHFDTSFYMRDEPTVNTNFLEEFLTDCKGIKHTLSSATKLVVDMMREVDAREKEVSLAKEAASIAGKDILEKVEDLKEMLKHANEANIVRAGEVYGEKSILAIEARELQMRLLSLSDQKHKSLRMIGEIHQTLEARLLAIKEERIKAEQEKFEMERKAVEALSEQEQITEKIVHESKLLQREAEKNSKLREFLMERGNLVDTLQGEISVICKNVLALKNQVDGHVSLDKKRFSSRSTSSLPSFTAHGMSSSSDYLTSFMGSFHYAADNIEEILQSQHSKTGSSDELAVPGADLNSNSDDGWEYLDGDSETELSH